MNCQNHPDREAKGTCCYCGQPFCEECLVSVNGRNYCKEHVSEAVNQQNNNGQAPQQAPTPVIIYNNNDNTNNNTNVNAGGFGGGISPKSRMVAALLCFFLGYFGIHRFYTGKIGTGILYLFTGGLCGIGALVDFIMILLGSFRDSYGMPITRW